MFIILIVKQTFDKMSEQTSNKISNETRTHRKSATANLHANGPSAQAYDRRSWLSKEECYAMNKRRESATARSNEKKKSKRAANAAAEKVAATALAV